MFLSNTASQAPSVCDPPTASQPLSESVDSLIVAQPQFTLSGPSGRLPVPYVFPLHNVRSTVQAAVQNGEVLRTGQRSEILEAIYQDASKYSLSVL